LVLAVDVAGGDVAIAGDRLLVGVDGLLLRLQRLEADLEAVGEVRAKLVAELAAASGAKGMVGGQMIDLLAGGLSLDQDGLTRLQNMKTGCLIAASCRLGAILGDARGGDCDALAAYGIAMGLAFQIADDVLDVESSAAVTGKATGKDAAAGKATFVSRLGLEGAKTYARELAAHQASAAPPASASAPPPFDTTAIDTLPDDELAELLAMDPLSDLAEEL
jgi:geranylgeranyl pyrophosphate synthase